MRKSVAVVSSALLTGAALVGFASPAQAAGEVKLETDAGVGYAVPHTASFGLKTSITAGNDTAELQYLKYKVDTDGSFGVFAVVDDVATEADAADTLLVSTSENTDTITYSDYSAGEVAGYLALYIVEGADGSAFEATDSNAAVTVTAFIDKDGDDVVDAGEWNASQTVTWLDNANYDVVNVMKSPSIGTGTLTGTVTSATMNLAQTNEDTLWVVDFAGLSDDNNTLTYDAVNNELDYASASLTVAAGSTYGASLEIAATDTAIAVSTKTVAATDADNIEVAIAAGANNTALAAGASGDDISIRPGSGSFVIEGNVEDSADAVVAGETVTITITEDSINELGSGVSFSVGGQTLTNADSTTAEFITADVVSDAVDGTFSFTVSYSGTSALRTDAVDITLDVNGVDALEDSANTGKTTDVITATVAAATVSAVYSADVKDDDEDLVFATDASFTLTYHVTDQYGQLYTGSGMSVSVSDATNAYTGAVVNGVARVTFPGYDADSDGALTMTADVVSTGTNPSESNFAHVVFVGAEDAVTAIALAGTFGTAASKTALNTEATVAADPRVGTATTAPDNDISNFTATLRDVNGNTTRGQVTLSGANLMFEQTTDSNTSSVVVSAGSVTVWATDAGVVDVDISSQVAGSQVLTVTSNGVSVTKTIVFADAAADAGTSLTISTASYVAAGSTATVIATLTDAFGNPVNTTAASAMIAMTYTGPGLVYPSTTPVETDAAGQAKISVLLGSADTGTGTITVSYDQGDDGDFTGVLTGDLDLNASTSFTVGTAPATQKVNAGSFKGYVAVYAKGYEGQRLSAKIGKDWVIVDPIVNNQESGTLFRVTDFTGAGVDIAVRIYIDRVLMDTINLTTK